MSLQATPKGILLQMDVPGERESLRALQAPCQQLASPLQAGAASCWLEQLGCTHPGWGKEHYKNGALGLTVARAL